MENAFVYFSIVVDVLALQVVSLFEVCLLLRETLLRASAEERTRLLNECIG